MRNKDCHIAIGKEISGGNNANRLDGGEKSPPNGSK
jgi:hypothetical protein